MKLKLTIERYLNFCLLVLIVGSSCSSSTRDVKAEIEKANEVYMAAISNQDVEAIVALHTPNALVLPSNHDAVRGSDAIRQTWEQGFKHGLDQLKFITSEATATGTTAIEHGTYQVFIETNQMVDHGKYIVIWEKVGQDWKIAKDIWNSSMPPVPRAGENDTIAMAFTKVKPENMKQMITMANDVFAPAFDKHFSDSKATARLFRIVNEEEGEGELLYFIDPYLKHHVHDVKTILSKHYSEEEVAKYMQEFESYIIKQELVYAVPIPW